MTQDLVLCGFCEKYLPSQLLYHKTFLKRVYVCGWLGSRRLAMNFFGSIDTNRVQGELFEKWQFQIADGLKLCLKRQNTF